MDLQHLLNLNISSLLPATVATARVEHVTMNVIVFLLIAGTVSARLMPVQQFNTWGIIGDVVIERRNDGYISHNPENTPFVNSNFKQNDKVISTRTNQRFLQFTMKCNEQNDKDSLNIIDAYENDHRLRTIQHTTTEYTVQDFNVYTNKKDQKLKDGMNPVNEEAITGEVCQRCSHNVVFIKSNDPKLRPENRPAGRNQQDKRKPETSINIPIHNSQNERTNNITYHPTKSGSILETVPIQPIPTHEAREKIEKLLKTDSGGQIWMWGIEGTSVKTTQLGSLNNKAAFSGDKCPTGKFKVQGVCVEKD